ncbi:MAG: histidine phosphatase family protein [Desulfovibrionaceae bacterium]
MIVLLRHAAVQNAKGRFIGTTDLPLSPAGTAQAEYLASALRDCGLRAIYASPLVRAMDTAGPLARACGLVIRPMPELSEIRMGEWEGRSQESVRNEQPEAFAARGCDFAEFRPPGGETFLELADRAERGLKRVTHEPRPCAVVTHAGVLRVLLCRMLGLDLQQLFRFRPLPAHAILIRPEADGFGLVAFNCPPEGVHALLGR